MSNEENAAMKQLLEITAAIGEIKTRAEVAEAKLAAAEERAKLILDAKDLWMRRALEAEKKLEAVK